MDKENNSTTAVAAAPSTTTTTDGSDKFVAIGPPPIGKDGKVKKYKFVEPPGMQSWVISFAKKSMVCALIYAFGYFKLSVGWLFAPLVLMVIRDQWKTLHETERALSKAVNSGNEREIILGRLGGNLPSWVVFPDVERAEWLNQMIKQLWPRINHYTYSFVLESIEPGLRETLEKSYKLPSFRFEKIVLGDTPLRVRGVKVYSEQRTDRNEIIMDLDILYVGDCDFRFSVGKIQAGIKDLQLSGILRLVMKPLINQIPLIGGVEYFFLNAPSLDFNLIGVADFLDMPGLADLLRRIVQEQIAAMCVLPNKMYFQLSDQVDRKEITTSKPEGVLRICAIEARNLLKKDVNILGTGKSDPYVVLSVGAQQFKSKTINNTVNPKWEFYCEMIVQEFGQLLNVEVFDFDEGFKNDFLGRTSVDLSLVYREGSLDLWLDLEDVKKGQIHLKLTWLNLTNNASDLKNSLAESQNIGLASSLLTVRLDSCRGLPILEKKRNLGGKVPFKNSQKISSGGSKPDPYAILSLGKTQYESMTMQKTSDPVFEEEFHFLVRSPLTDTLLIKFMDRKSNIELGLLKQSLDLVYNRPGMKMEKQNLTLNASNDAKVALDLELHVFKAGPGHIEEEVEEEEDQMDEQREKSLTPGGTDKNEKKDNERNSREGSHEKNGKQPDTVSLISHDSVISETVAKSVEKSPLLVHPSDMKIRLTIRYNQNGQLLIVVVHSVSNLPVENSELPDPYIKLYVLPERNKKLKTTTQKDVTDPIYDERFEFPLADLKGKTLHVTVCDKKFIRSSPKIGEAYVPLDEYQCGNTITTWYPLQS